MPLLKLNRVFELIKILFESEFVTWKFAKPNRVSLFSKPQETFSYCPSVNEAQKLDPQFLHLFPTDNSMLYNESTLYKF